MTNNQSRLAVCDFRVSPGVPPGHSAGARCRHSHLGKIDEREEVHSHSSYFHPLFRCWRADNPRRYSFRRADPPINPGTSSNVPSVSVMRSTRRHGRNVGGFGRRWARVSPPGTSGRSGLPQAPSCCETSSGTARVLQRRGRSPRARALHGFTEPVCNWVRMSRRTALGWRSPAA